MAGIVDVRHSCSDGWHKFTSVQVPGLYLVAEQNHLEEAYGEIPILIESIIRADFGTPVTVEIVQTYSDYLEKLPPEYHPEFIHYSVKKAA
jgi:hypothetical protein